MPAHQGVSDRMRDPRLSLRLGVEGICRARHAGGREASARPDRERQTRARDLQPGHQGRDRSRRKHHGRADARDRRRRGDLHAGEHDPRGLYARRENQPRPGHHHRRHQIRIRPRCRRPHHPDRRGDDPRQFAVLGGGRLQTRPAAAEFRQAAAARLSRRRAPGRPLERRGSAATAAGKRRGRHQQALSRSLSPHHRRRPQIFSARGQPVHQHRSRSCRCARRSRTFSAAAPPAF